MKNYLSLLILFLATINLTAQSPSWSTISESKLDPSISSQREIVPNVYRTVSINFEELTQFMGGAAVNKLSTDFIDIPMPDGSNQQFEIEESRVFSMELAAKYPQIKCFKGKGINDPSEKAYFGYSPKGFHAMILSTKNGTSYIDRYANNTKSVYVSYYRKDYTNQSPFECLVEDVAKEVSSNPSAGSLVAGDCQLRSYRLALACTGEYSTFHGGTKELVLAEYATAMTRVNGIYETDNGVTMELVGNTDEVIFLDAGSDPYSNNNGGTMLGENQATLDNVIGSANYDIGHVFSTGGGGIASLNSPCGNGKARGVTGLGSPINDPFLVDYVCHEMGHQFGANHTQNNSCNRNNNTAMEPGSASTIMGYAGICAPNVANNSDDHFHAISIQEIANFIVNGGGANCADILPSDNSAPELSIPSSSYNLPIGTSFVLTATATDADDDALTFCWEQMDNEIADMPPSNISTGGPAFLSLSPMESPSRYFPNLNAILTNTIPMWEVIPFAARDMNFRCTVRDNNSSVGCTDEVNIELTFAEEAGPFLVEYPNGGEEWDAGESETVTWDVAGTDLAPVSCDLVDLVLSVDAGLNYEVVLATAVENDGSHEISVPGIQVDFARVMIRCSDNVFFDISDNNFKINTPFSVVLDNNIFPICEGEDLSVELNTEAFDGFDEEITFSIEGLPGTTVAEFTNNPINPSESTTLNLTNINGSTGQFVVIVKAVTSSITLQIPITIILEAANVEGFELVAPADGLTNQATNVELSWASTAGVSNYNVVLATDPGFNNLILSLSNYASTSLVVSNLDESTVYYWKVQANNNCAGLPTSPTYAFQTVVSSCDATVAEDLPIEISSTQSSTITASININGVADFNDFKTLVEVDHTWLGDIIIRMISPSGQIFVLMDQPGVPDTQFGCDADDFTITFQDDSANTQDDLENTCGNFEETYQASSPFADLSAEEINGEWTLEIEDVFNQDGGALINWEIQICSDVATSNIELKENIFAVEKSGTKSIRKIHLEMLSSVAEETSYVLLNLPMHGTMEIDPLGDGNYELLQIGTFFSQLTINNEQIRYTHNGNEATIDEFRFDVVDSESNWTHNQVFEIIINQGEFAAYALCEKNIFCADGASGIIEIDIFGNCPAYSYSLDGVNFQDSPIFMDLTAGNYTATVLDNCDNMIMTNQIILTDQPALNVAVTAVNYDLEVQATGGNPAYEYSLDGVNFQSDNIFGTLDNGMYTVYVRDVNGCISTSEASVDVEPLVITQYSAVELLCFESSTGKIIMEVAGGIMPYQFSLDGENYQDENLFDLLQAGTYTVYIQDAGGKIITQEVEVVQPDALIVSYTYEDNIITITGSGGIGNITYGIDGGIFSDINEYDMFPSSEFFASISDENGCVENVTVFPLTGMAEVLDVSCFGEDDGQLNLDIEGGFVEYMYSLDNINFQTVSVFSDLPPGIYDMYVQDANNNTIEFLEYEIVEPAELTATATTSGTTVIVNAEGGTGDYGYNFNGGNTFSDSNIGEVGEDGEVTIKVRDENGCIFQFMYTFVDVKETEDLGFLLYPNPMLNQLIVQRNANQYKQNATIEIVNNLGQLLMSRVLEGQKTQVIDVSILPSGLYHIILTEGDHKAVEKLIKL